MNDDLLYFWMHLADEPQPILCGELELLQGRRCVFTYAATWLAHPQTFALCPDMPLHTGVIAPAADQAQSFYAADLPTWCAPRMP